MTFDLYLATNKSPSKLAMTKNEHQQRMEVLAARRAELSLIREGLVSEVGEELTPSQRVAGRSSAGMLLSARRATSQGVQFHVPSSRPRRLRNASGETSFHFGHRAISKTTLATYEAGLRLLPGAARAHAAYVERESAVAKLEEAGEADAGQRASDLDATVQVVGPGANESCPSGQGVAAEHDDYLTRPSALAVQPIGGRALLTNIHPDDAVRRRFWSAVEEHEAVSQGDLMSFRVADQPLFWHAVIQQTDCPAELKIAVAAASPTETIKFPITSGEKMRRYLDQQPGWVKRSKRSPPGSPPPFATFHDGRSGRTQFRIAGELPDELNVAERFAIVRDFSAVFEAANLPFVAVMHQPDHKNNVKNWHFHLNYYDRPARQVTKEDIGELESKGYCIDSLTEGMWDFEVITPKKGRTNGRATPLKQKKVRAVAHKDWLPTLRGEMARITNEHLARAGVERRVHAGSFKEMGIVADPQEHLGSKDAAAETRGKVTLKGRENEEKQWSGIMAEIQGRFERTLSSLDEDLESEEVVHRRTAEQKATREAELVWAATLEREAWLLHEDIQRSRSRAVSVRAKNGRLLAAYASDPSAGSARERIEAETLVAAAETYLDRLDKTLAPSVAAVQEAHASVSHTRDAKPAPIVRPPQPQRLSTMESPAGGEEAPVPAILREQKAHDAPCAAGPLASPDRTTDRQLIAGDEIGAPVQRQNEASPEMSKAAKQAALAAAMRGRGR